ncbi:MAG: helix-hairpin-helix domain-containing protein [Cyclobacteriaceae bacterium]|nr:helix-hairpin-helix domain-containing protein [Cyclobacteriaceae bacterium]
MSLLLLLLLILALYSLFSSKLVLNKGLSEKDELLLDSVRMSLIYVNNEDEKRNAKKEYQPNNEKKNRLLNEGFSEKEIEIILRIFNQRREKKTVDRIKKEGIDREKEVKFNRYNQKIAPFNINTADTMDLKQIKGIGSVLANRIVNFRDKLGGFISLNQLYEVYHLDSAVVEKMQKITFIDNNFIPTRIKINLVSEGELAQHPYIVYKMAKLIVVYRNQHGGFKGVEDLYNIQVLDSVLINRIFPYLSFENSR